MHTTHNGLLARDLPLEAHLMDIAARAAECFDADGNGYDAGLSAFADARAWPGGVRADMDGKQEAREEFADARNYLVWEIRKLWPLVEQGEPEALDEYSQLMGALSGLVTVWHRLHHIPS